MGWKHYRDMTRVCHMKMQKRSRRWFRFSYKYVICYVFTCLLNFEIMYLLL